MPLAVLIHASQQLHGSALEWLMLKECVESLIAELITSRIEELCRKDLAQKSSFVFGRSAALLLVAVAPPRAHSSLRCPVSPCPALPCPLANDARAPLDLRWREERRDAVKGRG